MFIGGLLQLSVKRSAKSLFVIVNQSKSVSTCDAYDPAENRNNRNGQILDILRKENLGMEGREE